jgi:hypothetical protein
LVSLARLREELVPFLSIVLVKTQPRASSLPPLHDLFANAFARYLSARPSGLQMPHGPLVSSLLARLLLCRPARTLYENHQPRCRSLDGIQSITEGRACAACLLRKTCTSQIYIELLHDPVPYRLLLAYSSARNFMLFVSRLRQNGERKNRYRGALLSSEVADESTPAL